MATTFRYNGVEVVVEDPALGAKIEDIVAGGSYSMKALEQVVPKMVQALYNDQRLLSNLKLRATGFTVRGGKVWSEVDGVDRRRSYAGSRLGS